MKDKEEREYPKREKQGKEGEPMKEEQQPTSTTTPQSEGVSTTITALLFH